MTKLEDLIYSLATVLVRYHDLQSSVKKLVPETDPTEHRKKSREVATNIIKNTEVNFSTRLSGLINACTNGYADRKPLLNYLLHELNFLKAQYDRKSSFEPALLEEYKNQITQFLFDLTRLFNTEKGKTYKVKYSKLPSESKSNTGSEISLGGFINTAYTGGYYCSSGTYLKEEVLDPLRIDLKYTYDQIKLIAEKLCEEHQNALLVPELKAQLQAANEQNLQQQETIAKLDSKSHKLQETIGELEIKSQGQLALLTTQHAKIQSQELTIGELNISISELTKGIDTSNPFPRNFGPGLFPYGGIRFSGKPKGSSSNASLESKFDSLDTKF